MSLRTYQILDTEIHELFQAMPRPWPAAIGRLWLHHVEDCVRLGDDPWVPRDASEALKRAVRARRRPGRRVLSEVTGWKDWTAAKMLEQEGPFLDGIYSAPVH